MVSITGNLNNLQSSVDFYISTTLKDITADSKEMRNQFFRIFKSEDSYREENFLLFQDRVSDDYSIVSGANPILVNGEECYSSSSHSFAKGVSVDEEYPDDTEVYVIGNPSIASENEKNELETKKNILENEDTYSENEKNELETEDTYSENEKNELETEDTYSENEKNRLDSKVAYLENEDTHSETENSGAYSFSTALENEKADLETKQAIFEYEVRYLENEEKQLENENIELEGDEFINYSPSKDENMNLEDEEVFSENENIELEGDEFIDHSLPKNENLELVVGDIELEEENLNPFSSINISAFTVSKEENPELEEDKVSLENENLELIEENLNPFSCISIGNFIGSEEGTPSIGESEGVVDEFPLWGTPEEDIGAFHVPPSIDEVLEETQDIVVGVKIVEEEVVEVPKDLRDFVRLHHNCEMSFALNYFTKKEIDKQLSLGRVFKRKNRLLI